MNASVLAALLAAWLGAAEASAARIILPSEARVPGVANAKLILPASAGLHHGAMPLTAGELPRLILPAGYARAAESPAPAPPAAAALAQAQTAIAFAPDAASARRAAPESEAAAGRIAFDGGAPKGTVEAPIAAAPVVAAPLGAPAPSRLARAGAFARAHAPKLIPPALLGGVFAAKFGGAVDGAAGLAAAAAMFAAFVLSSSRLLYGNYRDGVYVLLGMTGAVGSYLLPFGPSAVLLLAASALAFVRGLVPEHLGEFRWQSDRWSFHWRRKALRVAVAALLLSTAVYGLRRASAPLESPDRVELWLGEDTTGSVFERALAYSRYLASYHPNKRFIEIGRGRYALAAVLDEYRGPGPKIGTLQLIAHGSPGRVGSLSYGDLLSLREQADAFAPGAEICFRSCSAGKGGAGEALVDTAGRSLLRRGGGTVSAPTTDVLALYPLADFALWRTQRFEPEPAPARRDPR